MDRSGVLLKCPNKSGMGARRRAPLSHHYSFYFTNNFFARAALAKSSTVTSRQLCCAIRGESPSQEQTTFSGSSRWGIVYFHAVATKEFESPLFRRPSHQDQSRKMRAVVARRCNTDLRKKLTFIRRIIFQMTSNRIRRSQDQQSRTNDFCDFQ
jgi:hypothetical protein